MTDLIDAKLIEVAILMAIAAVPSFLVGWGYGYNAGVRRVLDVFAGPTPKKEGRHD